MKKIMTADEIREYADNCSKLYFDLEENYDSHSLAEDLEQKFIPIELFKRWIARERLYEKDQRGIVKNAEGFFKCIDKIEREILCGER